MSGNNPAGILDVGMPPGIQPVTDIPGKLDQQIFRKRESQSIGIIRVDKVSFVDFWKENIGRFFYWIYVFLETAF